MACLERFASSGRSSFEFEGREKIMKNAMKYCSTVIFATALLAQGPPPGRMHGGGPWGGGFMAAGPASGTPVTGAPYSAVQTSTFQETLANGTTITRQNETKVYRDSAGRVRMERSFTPPGATNARTSVVIYDPVAASVSVLEPANQTAFKRTLPAQSQEAGQHVRGQGRTRAGETVNTENLGTQVINGLSATGTRTTTTIAAGTMGNSQAIQRVHEVWMSTDLKIPVMIKNTDPMNGNTVTQLTNIVRSEPDASLFQVPSNYTVKTQAQGMRGHRGGPPPQQQ
jgi:hypothetical protein